MAKLLYVTLLQVFAVALRPGSATPVGEQMSTALPLMQKIYNDMTNEYVKSDASPSSVWCFMDAG